MTELRSGRLSVQIAADGRIIAIRDLHRGLELLGGSPAVPAARIELANGLLLSRFTASVRQVSATEARLVLRAQEARVDFSARISVREGSAAVVFDQMDLKSGGGHGFRSLTYPVLSPVRSLSEQTGVTGGSSRDRLAHPDSMGFLFRDPQRLFIPGDPARHGVRGSWYPGGFDGSPIQMAAYYVEADDVHECAGFWLFVPDNLYTMKSIDFYAGGNGGIIWETQHRLWDQTITSVVLDYPVELRPLDGDWWTAAGEYRTWALQQPWCELGPLAERATDGTVDRALLEDVRFATSGLSVAATADPRLDSRLMEYEPRPGLLAPWFSAFEDVAGGPILHISGYLWSSRASRRPVRSNADTELIRSRTERGDVMAGWFFDQMLVVPALKSRLRLIGARETDRLCPLCSGVADDHLAGDRLGIDTGFNALYYDIAACVGEEALGCEATDHGHPPGYGRHFIEALRQQYAATLEVAQATGRPFALGQELMAEPYLREFSFYRARSYALPSVGQEGNRYREWIESGAVEVIPLFDSIYHEFGPLRVDGVGKLSQEAGGLFYWTAARVVLDGGLVDLDYTTVPPELFIPSGSPDVDEVLWPEPAVTSFGESFAGPLFRVRSLAGQDAQFDPPMGGRTAPLLQSSPKQTTGRGPQLLQAPPPGAPSVRQEIRPRVITPSYAGRGQADLTAVALIADGGKQRFLRHLGEVRCGFGNAFLAYGQMVRPLPIVAPVLPPLRWQFMNYAVGYDATSCSPPDLRGCRPAPYGPACFWCDQPRAGQYRNADQIIHSAFRRNHNGHSALGLFFINLEPERDGPGFPLQLAVDMTDYGFPAGEFTARLWQDGTPHVLGQFHDVVRLRLALPERRVVMVEITAR